MNICVGKKFCRGFTLPIMLLALALGGSGCDDVEANKKKSSGYYTLPEPTHFTVGIAQEGKLLPVSKHMVTLTKKPFVICFYLEEPGAIMVQASFSPDLVNRAQSGQPLDELLMPEADIAEKPLNPDKRLYVHDEGLYHNLNYQGPETHRFDGEGMEKLPKGGCLARRSVEVINDGQKDIAIKDIPTETVYLLFVHFEKNGDKRIEKQRDWLKLKFR